MLKSNCVHFPLDRPCRFHKKSGVKCGSCGKYIPATSRRGRKNVLIIKIGAMGDVMRTTFLLEGLKKKYNRPEITWVVAPRSAEILEKNPNVARVWDFDCDIFAKLARESFDVCINLDLAPESVSLATLANAAKKIGFWLGAGRKIAVSGPAAGKWLEMSAFDDLKKTNRKTYQYWMSRITGLPRSDYGIHTSLTNDSLKKADKFAARHGLKGKKVVGINPGAGGRWKYKKWTDSGYLKLIKHLSSSDIKVILLGGPEEENLISKLVKASKGKAVSSGTGNTLPEFFALVNLCDVVVTGDTLALHAALGLGKKVVALFGPTSSAEIEMYGLGRKIVTPAACACCYLPDCNVKPDCMKLISPDKVIKAVESYIK